MALISDLKDNALRCTVKRLSVANSFSCQQIKSELNLNVTARRVNQILNENFDFKKQKNCTKT